MQKKHITAQLTETELDLILRGLYLSQGMVENMERDKELAKVCKELYRRLHDKKKEFSE